MVPALGRRRLADQGFIARLGHRSGRTGACCAHGGGRLFALLGAVSGDLALYLVLTMVLSMLAKRLEAPAHLRGR